MSDPISGLEELLRSLEPERHEGVYVFCSVSDMALVESLRSLGQFREAEGVTLILSESDALRAGLKILFRAAWISLKVHSDLSAVGLTATVSGALAAKHISCNMVAGAYHDHLFVPIEKVDEAMACLQCLQAGGRR